jgi:hypothetical protein
MYIFPLFIDLSTVTHVRLYGKDYEERLSQLPVPPLQEAAQKKCLENLLAAKELFHTSPRRDAPTNDLKLYQCPGRNNFCQLYWVKCMVSTFVAFNEFCSLIMLFSLDRKALSLTTS